MKYFLAAIIILLYIIFCPFMIIWSLNTLFFTEISYTFNNWLAIYIFLTIFNIKIEGFKKNNKYMDEKVDKRTTS